MDFRYLMVQSIALLFWETQLPESGVDSRDLVKEIIKAVPNPDSMAGTEEDRENLIALRDIASQMCVMKENYYTREQLLSKLKLNIRKDPELRDDVVEVLQEVEENKDLVMEKIKYLNNELKTFFYQKDFKDEIKRIAGNTIFQGAPEFNVADMARQVMAAMERFATSVTQDEEDPTLNGKGDSSEVEEVAKLFMNVQEDLAPDSVIKTGWQAFNRMCGEVGGLRRGNMYVIGALPNKGKSLITSYLTLHTMMYNTPYMFDPTKKPCVVHISTENDLSLNMKIWFRYLWENHFNEPCNLQELDAEYMATWFKEQVEKNGYTFKFYHVNPTNSDYRSIISKLMQLESEGYEVHLCAIDYLAMINGDGLGDENRAFWIRQLFKVMRNHCNPRKITLLTPHQVATDAAMYIRQGTDDFVQQIAGKRFWADCRSIDMEVDMEIVLNVEKSGTGANKQSYMAFGRGKDRSSLNTPEEDKFFFLPFERVGSLRPDINGKDTSKRTIKENTGIVADAVWTGQDPNSGDF